MGSNLRGREPRTCRLEVRLNKAELADLESLAFWMDRTLSDIVRAALKQFVGDKNDAIQRQRERKGATGD